MDTIANPRGTALKKTMYEFLKEKYKKNEDVIDRVSHHLVTENDIKNFVQLIADVYEEGYVRAVKQHKESLEKLGLTVKIVSDQEK